MDIVDHLLAVFGGGVLAIAHLLGDAGDAERQQDDGYERQQKQQDPRRRGGCYVIIGDHGVLLIAIAPAFFRRRIVDGLVEPGPMVGLPAGDGLERPATSPKAVG
jgi:hypothetical protein